VIIEIPVEASRLENYKSSILLIDKLKVYSASSKSEELESRAPLLHAKIYLVDDKVGIGSANFTKSGIQGNVECLVWINDPEVANDVAAQITLLEKTLKEIPLDNLEARLKKSIKARWLWRIKRTQPVNKSETASNQYV